jgi:hypothetical protein
VIHTIDLLGRGFGPLIEPAEERYPAFAMDGKQVPKGKDSLTTCVSTVDGICREIREGSGQSFPACTWDLLAQSGLSFRAMPMPPRLSLFATGSRSFYFRFLRTNVARSPLHMEEELPFLVEAVSFHGNTQIEVNPLEMLMADLIRTMNY